MITTYLYAKALSYIPVFLILSSFHLSAQKNQPVAQDVLGHGFDIRYVDALDWAASSKGNLLVKGGVSTIPITEKPAASYHFVTTPYEFEKEVLNTDRERKPFLAINTDAHYAPLKEDGSDKLLFIYTHKKVPIQQKTLRKQQIVLDSAFLEDFRRLGRDITLAGFINRYGTHYAQNVVEGGLFMQRHSIPVDDYIYSPYEKKEFQEKVIEQVKAQQRNLENTNPFIKINKGISFTVGGTSTMLSPIDWTSTVSGSEQPIEVDLLKITDLLRSITIPDIENKQNKLKTLDTFIDSCLKQTQERTKQPQKSPFYKKYSLQFNQEITSIVKKSMGRDDDTKTYTGDIFFGGFSKDEAILKTIPLIEGGGLRLETLITDEKVALERRVLITIKPEDIRKGYVSVWDDTKKLTKANERTRLRVSGPPEAHTNYQDALRNVITKRVIIETVDEDIYELEYKLSLVKPLEIIRNFAASYNYVLDSEVLAAVTNNNMQRLDSLLLHNGNPRAEGLIESIIINGHPDRLLNYVLDKGAIPTTADLDILFEREHFDETKALILLERRARPKNNMIYKAVAYKSAPVIYALFREGATSQNNDLAFAIRNKHYPTIKALMSSDYEAFKASEDDLLLAATNNDADLAKKFIALDATADANILKITLEQENPALEAAIVSVTNPSNATLEVAALKDDTDLFSYFINKNARLENNTAAHTAVDNMNMNILDLALKNGGDPTEALNYSILKDNKPAIETSLQNKAKPNAVFAYATLKNDEQLFKDALQVYGGTPAIALDEAVKKNKLPMAATVLKTKSEDINPSKSVPIAVSNNNLEMLRLLIDNKANPTEGMKNAIKTDNIPITEFLIARGAETKEPQFLKQAVINNNIELSKVLVEKGEAVAEDAIIEAVTSGNLDITQYLLENGATTDKALRIAMETKYEDVILLLLEKSNQQLAPDYLQSAARKGNVKVVKKLLEKGFFDPTLAISNAIRYKKIEVLNLLLDQGGVPTENDNKLAIAFNFYEGVSSLIEKGFFDVTRPFYDGEYALHLIATSYEPADDILIPLLLNHGAKIDAQNEDGNTPLHMAARVDETEINLVQILLDNNASTRIANNRGMLPQNITIYKDVKKLLKKAARKM